ncbi:hypothetical protein PFISCL1PPCAC_24004, partial [Pristionchus fissidentatus]
LPYLLIIALFTLANFEDTELSRHSMCLCITRPHLSRALVSICSLVALRVIVSEEVLHILRGCLAHERNLHCHRFLRFDESEGLTNTEDIVGCALNLEALSIWSSIGNRSFDCDNLSNFSLEYNLLIGFELQSEGRLSRLGCIGF